MSRALMRRSNTRLCTRLSDRTADRSACKTLRPHPRVNTQPPAEQIPSLMNHSAVWTVKFSTSFSSFFCRSFEKLVWNHLLLREAIEKFRTVGEKLTNQRKTGMVWGYTYMWASRKQNNNNAFLSFPNQLLSMHAHTWELNAPSRVWSCFKQVGPRIPLSVLVICRHVCNLRTNSFSHTSTSPRSRQPDWTVFFITSSRLSSARQLMCVSTGWVGERQMFLRSIYSVLMVT